MATEAGFAELQGQRALVTGSAKRLGAGIAVALARAGCDVVVHYHTSAEEAEETAGAIRAQGRRCRLVSGSLDNAAEAEALFHEAVRDAPLDILVNSASRFPSDTMDGFDEAHAIAMMQANAFAPLALSRAFAAQGSEGCIINLLDTAIHEYDRGHFAYHLAKRTLHTITMACALEFAPRVRVNAIAPGPVIAPEGKDAAYLSARGDETPLLRFGNAEHVAEAAVFLARSTFITGEIIHVDGGRHLVGGPYD